MRLFFLAGVPAAAMLLALTVFSAAAHASLGGAPSSFAEGAGVHAQRLKQVAAGDAIAWPTAAPAATAMPYSVRETTLDSGTVVREYLGSSGLVFAVSWNGPFLPDLRSLLGTHFATLTDDSAARARRGHGRGRVHIARDDLVIESAGHMRAYSGRAWIASALPAGVTTAAIQ